MPVLPWQGVHLQIQFREFLNAIKKSLSVSEKERHFLQAKIGMLVTKNFEKEKVLVALSVRSAFDLYF